MEAFRKKIKKKDSEPKQKKEKKEKKSDPPAMEIEDIPPPAPAPVVARPKVTVQIQPTEMEMQDMSEKQQEADAMNTFRQRISTYRNSQARYRNPMAPGFDYANWKPYGKVRYRNQEAEYKQFAENLAPYVYSVVESACLGVEERRWASMTQQHPEELAAMESLAASRQISRAASRDRLAPYN